MVKQPRLTARQAEAMLLQSGFVLVRSKGSHRVYGREGHKIVLPFHAGEILHPKIIRQVLRAVEEDD